MSIKNHEGYPDPTPHFAIEGERYIDQKELNPGEVWTFSNPKTKDVEYFLCLATRQDFNLGIKLRTRIGAVEELAESARIYEVNRRTLYANASNIRYLWLANVGEYVRTISDEERMEVYRNIAQTFNMSSYFDDLSAEKAEPATETLSKKFEEMGLELAEAQAEAPSREELASLRAELTESYKAAEKLRKANLDLVSRNNALSAEISALTEKAQEQAKALEDSKRDEELRKKVDEFIGAIRDLDTADGKWSQKETTQFILRVASFIGL